MMEAIFAIIKDGLVDNLIVVDPNGQATIDALGCVRVPDGSYVAIGWEFSHGVFVPPQELLSDVQSKQIAIIEAAYQSANTAPISYTGAIFQADADSIALMAQVASALPSGAGITWYDSNNVGIALTDVQFAELRGAILMRGQPLFAKKQTLKQAIRSATSIAQVEAVVW